MSEDVQLYLSVSSLRFFTVVKCIIEYHTVSIFTIDNVTLNKFLLVTGKTDGLLDKKTNSVTKSIY